jgi:hypothetical protein
MTIEEFIKKFDNVRLDYQNRWMVWDDTTNEWVVYEKLYRKRVKQIGFYELLTDALYFLKDQENG